MHGETIKISA